MFLKFLYLASFLNITECFNIAIVGASSGLGKELVYKGVTEKNLDILAFTSNTKINVPYRGDSFEEKGQTKEFISDKVKIENYWNDISKYSYENLIFCTGAKPFENDYSDKLTYKFLENLPDTCKTISLISAYGVGDSLNGANLGIVLMEKIYLKDVYRVKNLQENLVNNCKKIKRKFIYRPKALSYGETYLNSISRADLADQILNDLQQC